MSRVAPPAQAGACPAALGLPTARETDQADIEDAPPSSVEPVRREAVESTAERVMAEDETSRARLIADITRLIREPAVPEPARTAGLTLIGWLARRRPGEPAHAVGVEEARASEQRLRAVRAKTR